MKKAVFLDKDGTLIENVPYNADPEKVRAAPFAAESLKHLAAHGYLLIVISNQPGIALGYFTEASLGIVRNKMEKLLGPLHDFYYCPHSPKGKIEAYAIACHCKKPAPGLLLRAAQDHGIDLHRSWMIGDILDDVEAGKRAGCTTILVNNGNETEWNKGKGRTPDFTVQSLQEAADIILTV